MESNHVKNQDQKVSKKNNADSLPSPDKVLKGMPSTQSLAVLQGKLKKEDTDFQQPITENPLQNIANQSAQVQQATQLQSIANSSPQVQNAQSIQLKANETESVNNESTEKSTIQRMAAPAANGLPPNLQNGIEGLSGIDMSDTKVHYNSSKPAQLQAHAYAQGTDIHLGPGQEQHLPHEAWHVVQQKQGRVKPTMQMKKVNVNDDVGLEKEADVMGQRALSAGATAQMKAASGVATQSGVFQLRMQSGRATDTAHLHESKKGKPNEVQDGNFLTGRGRIGPKITEGARVFYDPAVTDKKDKWYKAMVYGKRGWIRKSKVETDATELSNESGITGARTKFQEAGYNNISGQGTDVEDESETLGMAEELAGFGEISDDLSGQIDIDFLKTNEGGTLKDKAVTGAGAKSESVENAKLDLEIAGGAMKTFGGILGMASSWKNFKKSDNGYDTAMAVLEGVQGAANTAAGVSKVIDAIAKRGQDFNKDGKSTREGIGQSDLGAKVAGAVADGINSVKSFVETIKRIYDLHQSIHSDAGASTGEKVKETMEIISSLLDGVASTLKVVNGFLDAFAGGLNAGLTNAVPGLTIAISGAQIAIQVYNIIRAQRQSANMDKIMKQFARKTGASRTVMKKEGFLFMKEDVLREKIDYGRIDKIEEASQKLIDKGGDLSQLTDAEVRLLNQQNISGNDNNANKEKAEALNYEVSEYHMAVEMKEFSTKRTKRSSMKIGIELVKIAGDIAMLSGVGAVAGVPLKILAAGFEVGTGLFRSIKQWGRNKAASKNKKRTEAQTALDSINAGTSTEVFTSEDTKNERIADLKKTIKDNELGWFTKNFNADKSSEAKIVKRKKYADMIIDMIKGLPATVQPDNKDKFRRVEMFITAAGCSTNALYRLNGKPKEQRDFLIESMGERE